MNGRWVSAALVGMLVLAITAGCGAAAGYDVQVDLKNVSGQAKTNWPVILRVYTVLGRNLDPASVKAKGFHVYDPSGPRCPTQSRQSPPTTR